jgi:hypothetical protein
MVKVRPCWPLARGWRRVTNLGRNQLIVVCVYARRRCVAAITSPSSRRRRCRPRCRHPRCRGGSEIYGGGCGCSCSMRRIAGTTMWDDAARPTIEGCLGSDRLLPRIPFFKLLLLAPDGVTGQATSVGMRLDAPRLRQLVREAKLCTSLCPPIGRVNSAHAMIFAE